MKKNTLTKLMCLLLCLIMAAAMAGCSGSNAPVATDPSNSSAPSGTPQPSTPDTTPPETPVPSDVIVRGEGKTVFQFHVVSKDGRNTKFEIRTDSTSVGKALQEVDLIQGEMGEYGLYVKTVNGETLDYDKDDMYWAFYVDGRYALKSADQTEINPNSVYVFKAEKAD